MSSESASRATKTLAEMAHATQAANGPSSAGKPTPPAGFCTVNLDCRSTFWDHDFGVTRPGASKEVRPFSLCTAPARRATAPQT